MPLKYQSGEEIRKGDRVLFHGDAGEVEFVADPLVKDAETDWYIQEYGGGAMINADHSGRCFISETEDAEDLVLVSRAEVISSAKS